MLKVVGDIANSRGFLGPFSQKILIDIQYLIYRSAQMFCFGDPRQTTMMYEVTSPSMEINILMLLGQATLTKGEKFKMNFVQNNDTKSLNLRK